MKAISLHQPWASAVILGLKKIETRSHLTHVRGRIAIHAAAKHTQDQRAIFYSMQNLDDSVHEVFRGVQFKDLPFGALIGTVEIVACQPADQIILHPRERMFGNFGPGRFAWLLKDPIKFGTPIPCKGRQGWFNVD